MDILALVIASVALILAVGASAIAVECRKRLDALEAKGAPTVGTRGLGGGGR